MCQNEVRSETPDFMFEQIQNQWKRILEFIRDDQELGTISFTTWLQPLYLSRFENNTAYVDGQIPSAAADYVTRKYLIPLKVAIAEVTGIDCNVEFVFSDSEDERRIEERFMDAGLNPRYTFDTFVVGSNNKFAHAAALAVAESPGKYYNPLFVYGGVGLGKTHLMHSIAHFIIRDNPNMRVLYVTSEDFTNEVISAIRNGSPAVLTRFREKYRNIDVLLIDDIQFIIGKESTQEEFFHTFNTLHAAGKQIILSSDRPPKEFDVLEERIKSRFEWGLMADIQSPDFETRMAIVQKKLVLDGYYVDDKVLEYIASNIKSNIRELEGSLNKVIAKAKFYRRDADVALAEEALIDIISPGEKRTITPQYILDIVADHFGLSIEDLRGSKRSKNIAWPRQIAMYLIRQYTDSNFTDIGKLLGGRDHTTVIHGHDKIKDELQTDEELRSVIHLLKKKINPA